MIPLRSRSLLVALAALTGFPAWSAEPEDPPAIGNLPISSTTQPPSPQSRRPAAPTLPQATATSVQGPSPFPAAGSTSPDRAMLDRDVQPVQVPPTTGAPQPRTPATPATPATPVAPPAGRPPAAPGTPSPTAPPGETATGPPATPPGGTSAADEFARIGAQNPAAETGGGNLGFSDAPVMLGDQPPLSIRQSLGPTPPPPPNPPQPPTPPVPHPGRTRSAVFVPWVRGFKIADNQSPRPQDRVFFSFDFFDNLNGSVNRRIGADVSHLKVYRELFGVEKTFFDGNASIGLRVPVNSLTADSTVRGIGGTSTSFGNLTAFAKLILWQDQSGRNLISGGLSVTAPNGPTRFAGSQSTFGFHDAQIQPFVGYIFAGENWYVHGFEAIDVPTDPHDVTLIYNDIGIGYFIYRNKDPNAFVSSIAPTFETHVNIPVDHRGAFRFNDPAGTADVVDLTYGVNVLFRRRALLTAGFVNPVSSPKPFSYEWQLLLNYYFGRTRSRATSTAPIPPIGGS